MTPLLRLSTLAVALALAATSAAAATIVPHEARYRLALEKIELEGNVVDGGGEMWVRLERSCEAWTMKGPFVFHATLANGSELRIEAGSSVSETLDGLGLTFDSFVRINGEMVEALKGRAALESPGGPGQAIYTLPEKKRIPLPEGTGFPISEGRRSIDALLSGTTMRNYILFDGSTADGPFEVSDFAAGAPLALDDPPKGDVDLLNSPSWRVQSDFYVYGSKAPEPLQTLIAQNHANGVTSRMKIDLGFMVFQASLVEIARLPEPDC